MMAIHLEYQSPQFLPDPADDLAPTLFRPGPPEGALPTRLAVLGTPVGFAKSVSSRDLGATRKINTYEHTDTQAVHVLYEHNNYWQ